MNERMLIQFGRNVSRVRFQAGLSQTELAGIADLDRTYLSGIERGLRDPGLLVLIRLARALAVPIDNLIPKEAA